MLRTSNRSLPARLGLPSVVVLWLLAAACLPTPAAPAETFPTTSRGLSQVARWTLDEAGDAGTLEALPAGNSLEELLRAERLAPVDLLAWTAAENRAGDRVVLAVFGLDTHAEWEARHQAAGDLEQEEQRLAGAVERCFEQREASSDCGEECGEEDPYAACQREILPYATDSRTLHAARISAPRDGPPVLDAVVEIGKTFSAYSYPAGVVPAIAIEDIDRDGSAEAAVRLREETEPYCPCGTDATTSLLVFDLGTFHRQVTLRLELDPGCSMPAVTGRYEIETDSAGLAVDWAYYPQDCTRDDRGWPVGRPVSTTDEVRMLDEAAGPADCAAATAAGDDCPSCGYRVERRSLPYDAAHDAWGPADGTPVSWSAW